MEKQKWSESIPVDMLHQPSAHSFTCQEDTFNSIVSFINNPTPELNYTEIFGLTRGYLSSYCIVNRSSFLWISFLMHQLICRFYYPLS